MFVFLIRNTDFRIQDLVHSQQTIMQYNYVTYTSILHTIGNIRKHEAWLYKTCVEVARNLHRCELMERFLQSEVRLLNLNLESCQEIVIMGPQAFYGERGLTGDILAMSPPGVCSVCAHVYNYTHSLSLCLFDAYIIYGASYVDIYTVLCAYMHEHCVCMHVHSAISCQLISSNLT